MGWRAGGAAVGWRGRLPPAALTVAVLTRRRAGGEARLRKWVGVLAGLPWAGAVGSLPLR